MNKLLFAPILFLSAICCGQDSTLVILPAVAGSGSVTLSPSFTTEVVLTGAVVESDGSISIPPSPGFRMNMNYDGKQWSYDFTNLKICLHYFLGTDGFESVWVQRFDMTEIEFVRLAVAVSDSLVTSTGFTRSSADGKTWTIESFGLDFRDDSPTKLPLIMDRIAAFFKKSKSKK